MNIVLKKYIHKNKLIVYYLQGWSEERDSHESNIESVIRFDFLRDIDHRQPMPLEQIFN